MKAGQRVLDVACGTGVVAVTAARAGAAVTALDLTPELLARARENSEIAGVKVDWHEGDAEKLPFADGAFDAVLSQFGHMFAPRPEVAVAEMSRCTEAGWNDRSLPLGHEDMLVGRMFAINQGCYIAATAAREFRLRHSGAIRGHYSCRAAARGAAQMEGCVFLRSDDDCARPGVLNIFGGLRNGRRGRW